MRYEDPVFRPPCESRSLIIQATIGCPHNKCTFCGMYKHKKYRVRPLEEIEEDIQSAGEIYGNVESVFLADGNTIAMRTDDLVRVLDCVTSVFPEVKRISVYGGARFIKGRKVEDLKRLKEHGLDIIYMGLESGDDEILEMVGKGATSEDYVRAAEKIRAAGIKLSTYVLAGLGGRARTREHAINSAKTLNRMKPDFVRIRTLALLPGFPMSEMLASGELDFEECSGREIAEETKLMLENLDIETEFLSDHVSNYLPVFGHLPRDKQAMLDAIDKVLSQPDHPALRPRVLHSL
jgi:radical SAM superfamily enzyme YgiQ (UPF0313 family)